MTHYSKTHVTFLDTKIKFKEGKLVTELYTKPSVPPVPPFRTSTGHHTTHHTPSKRSPNLSS